MESSNQGKYRESPCEMLLLRLHSIQLREMNSLVRNALPDDSFLFYCAWSYIQLEFVESTAFLH